MSAIEKTSAEAGAPAERTLSTKAATAWRKTRPMRPILCLLILLIVVFAITQSRFLTFTNLQNTVTSVADLWIIGMGMTLVIISGGFDLSVGATAALSGYLLADLLQNSVPGGLALLAAIIFGLVIGAVLNGFFVGRMRLNVFVVTLASMTALTGALNLWSETNSIYATAPIIGDLSGTTLLGVQIPVWIMAATFILALYVQTRTWFGRDVYAVGGSLVAAQLSGIRTTRTLIVVYGCVGACAALAGAIDIAGAGAATPSVDPTLPLQAIAAVLIGGTILTGGSGGVGGTALGVLFIGVLQDGLNLGGISSYWQQVVTGVILVTAVLGGRQINFGRVSHTLRSPRPSLTGDGDSASEPL